MTKPSDCRHPKEHFMAQQTCFRTRLRVAALALIVGVGAFAVRASPAASEALQPEQAPGVAISAFLFEPAAITVNAGEAVTWLNSDGVPHTSTGTSDHLWGGVMYTGQAFSYTFDSPGTYLYYCEIHPAMVGQVIVVAAE
jgi:plastocyanin